MKSASVTLCDLSQAANPGEVSGFDGALRFGVPNQTKRSVGSSSLFVGLQTSQLRLITFKRNDNVCCECRDQEAYILRTCNIIYK